MKKTFLLCYNDRDKFRIHCYIITPTNKQASSNFISFSFFLFFFVGFLCLSESHSTCKGSNHQIFFTFAKCTHYVDKLRFKKSASFSRNSCPTTNKSFNALSLTRLCHLLSFLRYTTNPFLLISKTFVSASNSLVKLFEQHPEILRNCS